MKSNRNELETSARDRILALLGEVLYQKLEYTEQLMVVGDINVFVDGTQAFVINLRKVWEKEDEWQDNNVFPDVQNSTPVVRPAEDSDTDIYSDVEAVDTGAHDQSWSSTEVEGLGTDVKLEESEGLDHTEEDTVLGSVLDTSLTSLTSLPSISDVISRLEEDIKQEESLDVQDQTLKKTKKHLKASARGLKKKYGLGSTARAKQKPQHCCKYCNQPLQSKIKLLAHQKQCKSASINTQNSKQPHNSSNVVLNDTAEDQNDNLELKEFKCQACSKIYKSESSLRNHEKLVHDLLSAPDKEEGFKCSTCGEKFSAAVQLKRHEAVQHSSSSEKSSPASSNVCNICNKKFKTKDRLTKHQSIHHAPGDKNNKKKINNSKKNLSNPLRCEFCGIKSTSKYSLKKHISAKHTNQSNKSFKMKNAGHNEASSNLECSYCNKEFRNRTRLNTHVKKLHSGKVMLHPGTAVDDSSGFRCDKCKDVDFVTKSLLAQHMVKVHNNTEMLKELRARGLVCEVCDKTFSSKLSLQKHRIAYHLPDKGHPFRCEICGAKFGSQNHLDRHVRGHRVRTSAKNKTKAVHFASKCPTCGLWFENVFSLRKHKASHVNKEENGENLSDENGEENLAEDEEATSTDLLFTCTKCVAKFSTQENLNRHLQGHETLEEKLNPVCKTCAQVFATKSSLRQHERRTHLSEEDHPYKCSICNAKFGNMSHLRRHQVVHTKVKAFLCQNCGKNFQSKDSMVKHEKMFHQEGEDHPFQCKVCQHKFGSQSNLDRHMLKHTGAKPHLCSECGRSFKQRKSLEYHQERIHNAESSERYKCNTCSSRFNTEWSLEKHKLIHVTLPEYHCEVCQLVCKTTEAMVQHHITDHPNLCSEKPHQCQTCCKRFTTRNYMQYHMTTHLKLKRHKCPLCGEGFKHYCSLSRHMKKRCKKLPKVHHPKPPRNISTVKSPKSSRPAKLPRTALNTTNSNNQRNRTQPNATTNNNATSNVTYFNHSQQQNLVLNNSNNGGPAVNASIPLPSTTVTNHQPIHNNQISHHVTPHHNHPFSHHHHNVGALHQGNPHVGPTLPHPHTHALAEPTYASLNHYHHMNAHHIHPAYMNHNFNLNINFMAKNN